MAPNHGGEPLGSILGPITLGPKNGSKPSKITMPQNSNYWLLRGHRFGKKNRIYGYGAISRWGTPRVHLGANGVQLGQKKWVKTVKNYHAPKFEFLTTPRSSIWAKNRLYSYGAKSRWRPPRVHLGANGVPMEPKKWDKTVKYYHAPKFEFLTTPGSSIWAKNRIYGYGAKSRWGPPRVHLGANGVPLGQKYGSKPSKITMPQNSNFWLLRSHRFGQKIEFIVMAPNHGRDTLGSILGPMGSHWGQKRGQNRKKLPCSNIRIFYYSAVIDLGKKSNLRLWRQITQGTP